MFASSKQNWLSAKYTEQQISLCATERLVCHPNSRRVKRVRLASASAGFSVVIIDEVGAGVSERNSVVSNLQGYSFPRINRCCHSAAKVSVHSCSCRIASAFVR